MTPSLPTFPWLQRCILRLFRTRRDGCNLSDKASLLATGIALFSRLQQLLQLLFQSTTNADWIGTCSDVLIPSRTIAWVKTVAVVVPSPAISLVFEATSDTNLAPIFSKWSSNSISLAMVTPSLVIKGEPNDFSRTTLRPLVPRLL